MHAANEVCFVVILFIHSRNGLICVSVLADAILILCIVYFSFHGFGRFLKIASRIKPVKENLRLVVH